MRTVTLALILICAASCTRWTVATGGAWWECSNRRQACSPEAAGMTLVQMDNTLAGATRDFYGAGGTQMGWERPESEPRKFRRVRMALLEAHAARSLVSSPPIWDDALADYVEAVITAERRAERLLPRKTPYWTPAP